MYGWVKYFVDGTKEVGTDFDARMKRVSWSRGRLTGMVGAELIHGNKRIAILAPGEFWQSDDYDCSVFEPSPSLIVRRIQKKIEKNDMLAVFRDGNQIIVHPWQNGFEGQDMVVWGENVAGKWLTLEYNVIERKLLWKIEENMI